MDEKSPEVQPMRHRVVLIDARFQTDFELQNADESIEGVEIGGFELLSVGFLLQHDDFVVCFRRRTRAGVSEARVSRRSDARVQSGVVSIFQFKMRIKRWKYKN